MVSVNGATERTIWYTTRRAIDPWSSHVHRESGCRANLAGYKCPTSVEWMAEIPRNPLGKILKTVLREPWWEGHDRRVS